MIACRRCPYYEQRTSYGVEIIRCANTRCPRYEGYKDKESEESNGKKQSEKRNEVNK